MDQFLGSNFQEQFSGAILGAILIGPIFAPENCSQKLLQKIAPKIAPKNCSQKLLPKLLPKIAPKNCSQKYTPSFADCDLENSHFNPRTTLQYIIYQNSESCIKCLYSSVGRALNFGLGGPRFNSLLWQLSFFL